jgi:hypothetical protein
MYIQETKVSNNYDKVVIHILMTAYMSHYNQCDYVRDVVQLSRNPSQPTTSLTSIHVT